MAIGTRVWGAGKLLLIAGGLVATYLVCAGASMRIALRTREVQVPNLTNRTAGEAMAIATGLGLTVKVDDTRRPDAKVAAGHVLAQDPAAGSVARQQRSVRLWLSAGNRMAVIPALVGETQRAAELRASQSGVALDAIAEIQSADYAGDVVVAQAPAAKTSANRVSLLINRGAGGVSYVMPDLIGVNGDRAADILRSHGFRVGVAPSSPYPGVPAGTVLRQSPQAGFRIAPGEVISLEVSR